MTDVLTPEQRKYNMSKIRAKDTCPELKGNGGVWWVKIKVVTIIGNGMKYRI